MCKTKNEEDVRRVCVSRRGETVRVDESGVDVVQEVGPDFTNVVHFVQRGDGRVLEGVGGR